MTRAKYPPLPTSIRSTFWLIRTFGVVIALGGFAVAGLALQAGRGDLAASAVALGLGFGALTWIPPLSVWSRRVMIAVCLAASVVAFQAAGWLALAWVVLLIVLVALYRRPLARSKTFVNLDPENVQIAAPGRIMKNAEAFQKDFLDHGFLPVGATSFVIRGATVVSSLLISPDSRAYASVTDSILHVTSVFDDGRVLVTRNNDVSPLPPHVLTNGLSGAKPGELIAGHAEALAIVATYGHHPAVLIADEVPQRAVDSDRAGIIWLKHQRDLKLRPDERGPLVGRKNLPEPIRAWEAAPVVSNQDGSGSTT